ncbi:RDD domain-containing protein [Oceanimonas sp. GK1]|uniref:RDD family protein n=1 Tax=Oceanimonas sp. (strain GK1 / IBRC-M 10197) TaxID=511062 RepID=UPI0002494C63|nr:RDD family protein [Oceanimonas sp. GK1]AEY00652.1 RDD domain-containing protein [Oceanimonas sp. GK1]
MASSYAGLPRAGVLRRLGAWLYDFLVVVALLMVAGFVCFGLTALALHLGWIDLGAHEDTAALLSASRSYQLVLLAVVLGFYCWFWRTSGQTLGMRAWRLRVQNTDGSRLTLGQCLVRALAALLGLGNFWIWLNPGTRLALQDRLAHCEMVVLTKEQNRQLLSRE